MLMSSIGCTSDSGTPTYEPFVSAANCPRCLTQNRLRIDKAQDFVLYGGPHIVVFR